MKLFINDIANICSCLSTNLLKYYINCMLDVFNGVHISHNRDMKCLLTTMSHDHKYESIIKMKPPLIKIRRSIKSGKISTVLNIWYNFKLEGKGVEVMHNHIVELLYINNYSLFFFFFGVQLPNNKNEKIKDYISACVNKTALHLKFVKSFINKLSRFNP